MSKVRKRPRGLSCATLTLTLENTQTAREIERKNYLRSLLSRTPAQIAEEDFLFIESRRIEQSYHRLTREREDLLKILGGREGIGAAPGGPQLGVGGGEKGRLAQLQQQQHASGSGEKKKRNSTGYEFEGLNGGGLPDGWAGEGGQRKSTPQQGAFVISRIAFPASRFAELMSVTNRYRQLYRTSSVPFRFRTKSALLSFNFTSFRSNHPTEITSRHTRRCRAHRTWPLIATHHANARECRKVEFITERISVHVGDEEGDRSD